MGIARAFSDQLKRPDYQAPTFDDRLGLMVDRELQNRRTAAWNATSSRPSFVPPRAWKTSASDGVIFVEGIRRAGVRTASGIESIPVQKKVRPASPRAPGGKAWPSASVSSASASWVAQWP